jgi:predicted AAA+ superfamily ATPase
MIDNILPLQLMADIDGLSVFSTVQKNVLLRTFRDLLRNLYTEYDPPTADYVLMAVNTWSCFTNAFLSLSKGKSFYAKITYLTIQDDNAFTRSAEKKPFCQIDSILIAFAKTDLMRLGRIASANITEIGFKIAKDLRTLGLGDAASVIEEECRSLWTAEGSNDENCDKEISSLFPQHCAWGDSIEKFAEYIHKTGAGEFGQNRTFLWKTVFQGNTSFRGNALEQQFQAVINQDKKKLNDLCGYEDQREVVISNTLRFIEGKPANNLLLYGDRGTGKSATVKAVCNEYAHRGLCLLEVKKQDLLDLPIIMEQLSGRALKFVLFIDDLSFEESDTSFTAFKAFLEGGVESKPDNVVVYATSNRRHLVKERIEDRPGSSAAASGDIRAFDTMQEQFSLADRFGVTVIFTSPNQDDYLKIAEFLGEERGLLSSSASNDERKSFKDNALRWERWFNGRSPRTAVQFINWLEGGDKFPWE